MSGKKMTIHGRRTARKVYEAFNPGLMPTVMDERIARWLPEAEHDWDLALWVERCVVDYCAFVRRDGHGGRVCHCSHCGGTFPAPESTSVKMITCPHCGRTLTIDRSRRRKADGITYVQKLQAVDGYQLIRTYCVEYELRIDRKPDILTAHVYDWIIGEDARDRQCYSVSLNAYSYRCRVPFNRWSERLHRVHRHPNDYYDLYSGWQIDHIFPRPSYPAWARKYRLAGGALRADMYEVLSRCMASPHFETLWKAGTPAAFILLYRSLSDRYWDAIKIARRAGFRFTEKNITEWCDTFDMLEREGLDTRNPKFIAPENLKEMHDWVNDRIERRREKERREQELGELERKEAQKLAKEGRTGWEDIRYRRRLGEKVLSFVAQKGDIVITPLQDLRDFYKEGVTLHHCVFGCAYYERPDSLILGARVKGRRTETIEVSMKLAKIVQCRGNHDQDSPWHKEIIQLMTSSLGRLMEKVRTTTKTQTIQNQ